MGAGNGEGVMHSVAGSGEGVGLGEGAMVFEVFFAAAGEGGMVCCSGNDVSWTLGGSGEVVEDYWERVERKRKSWVSSERSMSVGSGVALIVESSSMSAMVVEKGSKLALPNDLLEEEGAASVQGFPRPTCFYIIEISE